MSYAGPHILEKHIQAELIWMLRMMKNHGKLDFERINLGPVIRHGGVWASNPMAGWADIMIWIHAGQIIWWELKRKIGRQSEDQKEFQRRVEKMGQKYYLVRSLVQGQQILTEHGIAA